MSDRETIVQKALDRFHADTPPSKIPESLPVVEEFCREFLPSRVFGGMTVLLIQHHLGPLVPRIRTMVEWGLEASKCWFVDIPYSTNSRVRRKLIKAGFPSSQMADTFNDPIEPYSRRQIERVEFLIANLANQDNSKILVIDDGAYFTRTLNHMLQRSKDIVLRFKERGTHLVEQTTRGHVYLETEEGKNMLKLLGIPTVSIARTKTKYNLESPFIGASISQRMIRSLRKSGHLADLGRIFVLGFGAVGKATTYELSRLDLEQPIDVYDVKWRMLEKDIERIGANALRAFPENGSYNTVLGCTGKAAVHDVKQLGILAENSVLSSGSSAAIEFNREKFIDLAYKSDKDDFYVIEPEKTRKTGIHASIRMHAGGREFSFLNAGFPVNFDGSIECLPALLIQSTHGMLLAAAYETLSQRPGFHCLKEEYDDWFFEHGLKWIERYSNGAWI